VATEIQIQSEIIKYLKGRKDLIFWRSNTGGRGKVKFGEIGAPDIFIVYPKLSIHGKQIGALVAIEVKNEKGKLSEGQEAWRDKYTYFGVLYSIVRSVEDVEKILREVGER
jgi:hypothetical protein